MTAPITPDERAAMRERHTASRGAVQRGVASLTDVPRLLDALDTAEAERDEARKRAVDAEHEVMTLYAQQTVAARPAPVWDEDTVTEAVAREVYRRLHPGHILTHDFKRTPESDAREADAAYATWDAGREGWAPGRTCREIAARVLAVVRRHLPVSGESRAQVEATALREWIAEWPTTPDDGTFLADVARAGLARADRIEKGGTP